MINHLMEQQTTARTIIAVNNNNINSSDRAQSCVYVCMCLLTCWAHAVFDYLQNLDWYRSPFLVIHHTLIRYYRVDRYTHIPQQQQHRK